jgi:hypothetical protein
MKKRIISTMLAFTLCFGVVGYFKFPKLPTIPNITNSITLPTVPIHPDFYRGIVIPVKVVL